MGNLVVWDELLYQNDDEKSTHACKPMVRGLHPYATGQYMLNISIGPVRKIWVQKDTMTRTTKFGINHIFGGITACPASRRVCQTKNITMLKMEIISGASTRAVPQPVIGA